MEEFFTQLGNLLQGLFALAKTGFDGVNQVIGLIIAAVFGLFMMGNGVACGRRPLAGFWSTPWSRC